MRHGESIVKTEKPNKAPQAKQSYADHLARVIEDADADHSKALLQAHYKALHTDPPTPKAGTDDYGSSLDTED